MPAGKWIEGMAGGSVKLDIDVDDPPWCICACNAAYDLSPTSVKNHYIPGFLRSQLSKDTWFELTTLAIRDITTKIAAMQRDESALLLADGKGQPPEVLASKLQSLETNLAATLNKDQR